MTDNKYEALVSSEDEDGNNKGTRVTNHETIEEAVNFAYKEKERLEQDHNYKVTRISVEPLD